jgi:hypothetical protein
MSTNNICSFCLSPFFYDLNLPIYSETVCQTCYHFFYVLECDEIVYVNNVPMQYTFDISDIHREGDFPAIICKNGHKEWYKHGKIHRDPQSGVPALAGDLPASIWSNGTREWYKNDLLHREGDKPAVIYYHGLQEWYINGKLHRDGDNPAFIRPNGTQKWCKNGNIYENFKLENLINLHFLIRFMYICKTNKIIWSPDKLAGKFTKKQLFKLISFPKN